MSEYIIYLCIVLQNRDLLSIIIFRYELFLHTRHKITALNTREYDAEFTKEFEYKSKFFLFFLLYFQKRFYLEFLLYIIAFNLYKEI